ncbi:heat shock 70 kDa protein 16-like [Arachis ipaensis]|uniref:heat shock 70 kDa protein 16-like n=1 Tax=Arachis ipaensis TaxID=130454 RepID=UPI000A2B048D|nr:heat shock 70 kDa protein 16-like [Arachis ipaensis]
MSSTMFKLPALLSFKGTTSLCRWEHAGCVLPRGDGCSTRRVRVAHVATFAQHAGCVLGGSSGAASAMMHPKSRVSQVKRLIGRKFSDPDVQKELKMLAVETSEGPDVSVLIHLKYLKENHRFTLVQILAMLFAHFKIIAEKFGDLCLGLCYRGSFILL